MDRLRKARGRPVLVAHRGNSAFAPENTLEALELGFAAGADACEIDVQLSRDGRLVVIHDESLARTTNVAEIFPGDPRRESGFLVRDFDYEEIRSLDAGSWFLGDAPGHRNARAFGTRDAIGKGVRKRIASGEVRIPNLDECLDFVGKSRWLINVEIKEADGTGGRTLALALSSVEGARLAERVLISSFDAEVVGSAARAKTNAAAGFLSMELPDRAEPYVRGNLQAHAFHPSVDLIFRDRSSSDGSDGIRKGWREQKESFRSSQTPVLAFTVNRVSSESPAELMEEAGISGLFTDDPEGLLRVFG